jgi:hypothetical protein
MANVGVLVFWIFLAALFIARDWVTPDWSGKLSCVTGVAVGTGIWFIGLSWLVSRGHGKFSEKTLLRMEHLSGVGLLVLALIHGAIIARDLQKRRHSRSVPNGSSLRQDQYQTTPGDQLSASSGPRSENER